MNRHNTTPRPQPFRLDIQDKLALGVVGLFTVVAAAGLTFVHHMVSSSIAQMDEQGAYREATRVMDALTTEAATQLRSSGTTSQEPPLTDAFLQAMGRKTGAYVAAFRVDSEDLTHVQRRAISALRSGSALYLDRRPSDQWVAYGFAYAPDGRPTLIRATIRSPQSEEVTVTMQYAGILLLGLAAVVLLALMVLVRWMVVNPIRTLTRNVVEIGGSADLARRVALRQNDEIGVLSREFERMLDQLAGAQRSLMAYSFQVGAQDAALQALHDIGNAATPVTVSLELLREALGEINASPAVKCLDELGEEKDPARRQALLDALRREVSALQDAVGRLREQAATAVRHAGRIDAILRGADRGEAPRPGPVAAAPRDILSTAVAMLRPEERAGISVELDSSLAGLPTLASVHPGLYAVFHAVLMNAVEAIRASRRPGAIRIDGEVSASGAVTIRIADTGTGIAPEHLSAVLDREFTTKNRPKTMFNLHWCAGIVAASKGTIRVDSQGRDKGATVTVTLPRA